MNEWTPEEIKAFRGRLNLYQKELAEMLGVTREYVVYLERGVKRPSKTLRLLLDCIDRQFNENEKGKEKRKHGKRRL